LCDYEEDHRILTGVQRGDEAAVSALVERFGERVFRLAWRITGDAALAEDATAQTLVKLWTKARQWRGDAPARTWVFRMAVRTALDVQRSQQRWWRRHANGTPTVAADTRSDPADLAEQAEQQQMSADRLQHALMDLGPADRALVHLFYFEGRGLPEIESILGVSRDALKMRLSRARARLRDLCNDDA
jgi:RNA polymerase sigma-70 factor (ECF subfamily)